MSNFKVLIIENIPTRIEIFEMILDSISNIEKVFANDSNEAIAKVKLNPEFNLIILNYRIENSFEILEEFKNLINIPVFIFATGDKEDYDFLDNPNYSLFNFSISQNILINKIKSTLEIANQKPTNKLIQVKLHHYIKYSQVASEVFIKIHEGKYTKITDAITADITDKELLRHYLNKNIQNVYIEEKFFEKLIADSIALLINEMSLNKSADEILKIAGLQFHISLSGLSNIGISPLQVEKISEIIEETILEISKHSMASINLKKVIEDNGYLVGHSILIMIIAGSICKDTQLNFVTTMKRICLAAFFHDFSLDEEDLGKYETKIHEIEDERLLRKILEHPARSAELLPPFGEVLDDTKRIILEHHELPNGDGYPKRLNSTQIAPMSALFILAQQITYCLIRNDYDKDRLNNFIKNNEVIYKQGNFAKFYNIAAQKFS
jgi:response regulator RpfG family c-di-GMP phosphodiesterase